MRTRLRLDPLEARLTPAAGDLDPTFGMNGVVRVPGAPVAQLAPVPDGRLLALQTNGTVTRYEPDGDLDPSFGTGGAVSVPGLQFSSTTSMSTTDGVNNGAAVAAMPDGGVLVGWTVPRASAADRTAFDVVRITSAGTIDATFGTGGTAVVTFADTATLAAITIQSDGQVLIAGSQVQDLRNAGPNTVSSGQMVVVRLTSAGQPDGSFGTNGTAIVEFPAGSTGASSAAALAVQPDGRIVVAGRAVVNGSSNGSATGAAVARLTSDGRIDPMFGDGGRVTVPQLTNGVFRAVTVLSDGRVVLAGSVDTFPTATASFGVAGTAVRLTPAGQLDTGYGNRGIVVTDPFVTGRTAYGSATAAIDPQGRAVIDTLPDNFFSGPIFRLNPAGTSDTGFGTGGRVTTQFVVPAVAVWPNGDILLGGTYDPSQPEPRDGVIVRLLGNNPADGFVPATPGVIAAGGAADGSFTVMSRINVRYTAAGVTAAFPGFAGSVRTATADVTGDGTPDYVVGAGPGGPPQILVIDGKTGLPAANFAAFEAGFTGGVFVAAADLDRDGTAEVIVTPDQGGGPRVLVFSVAPGGGTVARASFFGIDDANFRGGARAALGDIDRDGVPDLVVAAGFLGGPRVAVFGGATLFTSPTRLVSDFFAFPGTDAATLRNGAFVAAGDVTGDGFADLVFGGGPGGGPRVLVLSGAMVMAGNVAGAQAAPVANYFVAGDSTDRGGIRVAVADADGDAKADVVTGSGAGRPARVRVYRATGFGAAGEPAAEELAPFGGATLPDGVYVG